jgi:hypothetical protein
MSNVSKEGFD